MSSVTMSAQKAARLANPIVNPWVIAMTVTLATFMEVLV